MNVRSNNKQGFTLIEVILVLAIAALIFLMVFVALPAVQASQRDTARKSDVSLVASAVTQYYSSERKSLSASTLNIDATFQKYISGLDQYDVANVDVVPSNQGDPDATHIFVYTSATCSGSSVNPTSNSRDAAVRIMLDNGNTFYCVSASA